ncbi:MAG: DJ-1/PfpI family protein [Deltaproteobacteria bacterium]|nr:DJ-1/PfpI family protein [Deltaproteobacteria bacterium]
MEKRKLVLVPLAYGSEELEAVSIIDILRRANAKVDIVTIGDEKLLECSKGVKILGEKVIDEVKGVKYDAIVVPGGMPGAENIRNSEEFSKILLDHVKSGALIGAICASPVVVLDYLGLTKGKRITCHPSFAPMLKHGIYDPQPVVVDSNIVTGKSAGFALEFALKIVELLFPEEVVVNVKKGLALLEII